VNPHRLTSHLLLTALITWGCASHPPIRTVQTLDLERFMGDWYVVANIPTIFEKGAYNAVETYRLDEDGTVETTFRFNEGGFDGPLKTYRSRAYVLDETSNAHWGMQFVWPFKAEYRVVYLSADYSVTIIGRSKRDYVWIMARAPAIPEARYRALLNELVSLGYDIGKVQKVPQQANGNPGGA
jgi:apolipoprotein D and lipocalin family protein